jgi:hypothetical protein
MSEPLTIEVNASHLYPGARGRLHRRRRTLAERTPCLVAFADLAMASGSIEPAGDGRARLAVAAYVTTAGTAIAAKRWLVELTLDGRDTALRVVRREVSASPV